MNTLTGLKKLLAKLGGDPTKVDNNGDAIDAIAEAYVDHEGDKLPELAYTDKKCFLVSGTTISDNKPKWVKTSPLVVGIGTINDDQNAVTNLSFVDGVTRDDVTKSVGMVGINMPNAWLSLFDQNAHQIDMERVYFGVGGFAVFVGYTVNKVGADFVWKKYTYIMHASKDQFSSLKVEDFTW